MAAKFNLLAGPQVVQPKPIDVRVGRLGPAKRAENLPFFLGNAGQNDLAQVAQQPIQFGSRRAPGGEVIEQGLRAGNGLPEIGLDDGSAVDQKLKSSSMAKANADAERGHRSKRNVILEGRRLAQTGFGAVRFIKLDAQLTSLALVEAELIGDLLLVTGLGFCVMQ